MRKTLRLSLKRAETGPDKGEPAEFGFVDDIGKTTEFHANFFLLYSPKPWAGSDATSELVVTPKVSVEGHLSSADKKANDAWRFRLGLAFDGPLDQSGPHQFDGNTDLGPTSRNQFYATVNAKYEANRDFNVTKTMAEFEITATVPNLWIGQTAYQNWKDQHPEQYKGKKPEEALMDFRWRPFLYIDAGATTDDGTTAAAAGLPPIEANATIFRVRPRIHAELWLNFIRKAMKMKEVKAYADYEYAYLPLEDRRHTHRYLQTGLNFGFNDNVGFALTYTVGEQSPEFAHQRTLAGSLTVTF